MDTVNSYSMSDPTNLTRFYCPLCGSNHYHHVVVNSPRDRRPRVVEGFFRCAGCTVMFGDAEAFMQLLQDSIVEGAHYRERRPAREYPPDAVTLCKRNDKAD